LTHILNDQLQLYGLVKSSSRVKLIIKNKWFIIVV
jgi:hypothetical protein